MNKSSRLQIRQNAEIPFPLGVWKKGDGIYFSMSTLPEKEVYLVLYKVQQGSLKTPWHRILMERQDAYGTIRSVCIEGLQKEDFLYGYEIEGVLTTDIYAKEITSIAGHKLGRYRFQEFDWEEDRGPMLKKEEIISYSLHVRGFTKHSSSGVHAKGTFQGVAEKVQYLKDMGINQILCMPVYEFEDTLRICAHVPEQFQKQELSKDENIRKNYWGYGNGFYFSPKESYSGTKDAVTELKSLVKLLHQNGMEMILEFYFPENISQNFILQCLYYWKLEYHIDGFLVNVPEFYVRELLEDSLLSGTRIYCKGTAVSAYYRNNTVRSRLVSAGEIQDGFWQNARRFLKGDFNQTEMFAYWQCRKHAEYSAINIMTGHDGFTLMDLVSYDRKHNEANGEENRDGMQDNLSWNCGVEGPTKKKKILSLRKKQMKNAMVMLFTACGIPILHGGDEFANSQKGNNNPYCQDNSIGWLNWNAPKYLERFPDFVKSLIQFRKEYPFSGYIERTAENEKMLDGYPSVSFHGEKPWYPVFENGSQKLGILHVVRKQGKKVYIYILYNMHWEKHLFGLPALKKGMHWYRLLDTSEEGSLCLCKKNLAARLQNQKNVLASERSIQILLGE